MCNVLIPGRRLRGRLQSAARRRAVPQWHGSTPQASRLQHRGGARRTSRGHAVLGSPHSGGLDSRSGRSRQLGVCADGGGHAIGMAAPTEWPRDRERQPLWGDRAWPRKVDGPQHAGRNPRSRGTRSRDTEPRDSPRSDAGEHSGRRTSRGSMPRHRADGAPGRGVYGAGAREAPEEAARALLRSTRLSAKRSQGNQNAAPASLPARAKKALEGKTPRSGPGFGQRPFG